MHKVNAVIEGVSWCNIYFVYMEMVVLTSELVKLLEKVYNQELLLFKSFLL